jgi:uncharacterized protein (TIGR02284 family)
MHDETDAVAVVNDLISTSHDGATGFRAAAGAVVGVEAKRLLLERARRIDQATAELTEIVRRMGGEPSSHGHPTASLHRAWIALRAAFDGHNDDAILREVERGESEAIAHYRSALDHQLSGDVRMVLEMQSRGAEMNLTRVQALRRVRTPPDGAPRVADELPPL